MTKNLMFVYIGLVALPLLLIAGTLEAGRNLSVPAAVAGAWSVTPAVGGSNELAILQSGEELTVNAGDIQAVGEWENGYFVVSGDASARSSCAGKRLRLELRPDGPLSNRVLNGRISTEGCPEAVFRATRAAKPPAGAKL